ncbi:MAG: hypothetical protein SGJ13_15370 [Actinomycetota bacterium]|nr:hypothetical protein [Actinomycetota bacterium]
MSMTDQNRTQTARQGSNVDLTDARTRSETVVRRAWRETKPSPKTTELWLTVIGVAILAVIYNASDDNSLTLWRVCLLGTIMAAAYVISRGFAKAGSHDDEDQATTYDRR